MFFSVLFVAHISSSFTYLVTFFFFLIFSEVWLMYSFADSLPSEPPRKPLFPLHKLQVYDRVIHNF